MDSPNLLLSDTYFAALAKDFELGRTRPLSGATQCSTFNVQRSIFNLDAIILLTISVDFVLPAAYP